MTCHIIQQPETGGCVRMSIVKEILNCSCDMTNLSLFVISCRK